MSHWTQEDVVRLMNAVNRRPSLYDIMRAFWPNDIMLTYRVTM